MYGPIQHEAEELRLAPAPVEAKLSLTCRLRSIRLRAPRDPEKPTEDHELSAQLNHTIVWCRDKAKSATFLTETLGLRAPSAFGPFLVVGLDNGVSLDFVEVEGEIAPQHYAFLIGEDDFDKVFGRICERGLEHWADPGQRRVGEINRRDGGRGVYFEDPDGHMLEILTRPYGSGG